MEKSRWPAGRRTSIAAAALAAAVVLASAAPAGGQAVWDLTPYRVQVFLVSGHGPGLTPQFEEDLAAEIVTRAGTLIGAFWDLTIAEPPDALRRALVVDIGGIEVETLPPESLDFDKVFLVAVLPETDGYQVVARELDVRTRLFNSPARVFVHEPAKLRDASLEAVANAFAPLAQLASVDKKTVTLRLRAGELPARDPTFASVVPGDLFRAAIRRNERDGTLRGVFVVPWTFLLAKRVQGAMVECEIHSGLRSPLSARRRGRVENLALALTPPEGPTRLTLKSHTEPHQPLAGYDVYAQSLDSESSELLGRTDAHGSVVIRDSDPPLRRVVVKHGGALLALLPMVPGLESGLEAQIPNDDPRLEAEGYLNGLQGDLIDVAIRREVLLTQARARMEEQAYDEAKKLLDQLLEMKSRDDFRRELNQEKKKIATNDQVLQRKIDRMFVETEKVLMQHLDPEPVKELETALTKARQGVAAAGS